MSVRVQSRVWEHSKATGNALMVLLKIADSCDDSGRNAWPSIASLARYCRCSESTVHRAIRELVELGELEVVVNGGGGRFQGTTRAPNLYRVIVEGCQSDTPAARGVSPEHARGVISAPLRVSLVTPDPSLEPSRTAAEVSRKLSEAHLRLAREALGVAKKSEERMFPGTAIAPRSNP
jgi:DNA-binding transcriptional MocR family regulator